MKCVCVFVFLVSDAAVSHSFSGLLSSPQFISLVVGHDLDSFTPMAVLPVLPLS